ncbi:hypothetical protein D3C86_2116630 [compost metagenome]
MVLSNALNGSVVFKGTHCTVNLNNVQVGGQIKKVIISEHTVVNEGVDRGPWVKG